MPLLLDDIDISVPAKKTADAKFFSSKLTGSGKKTGLLSEDLLPMNTVTNTAYAALHDIEAKQTSTQHDITTTQVPLAPIMRRALLSGGSFTLPVPDAAERFDLSIGTPSNFWDVTFDMTPQALALYEDKTGDNTRRDLVIQYRMELYFHKQGQPVPERAMSCSTTTGYGNNDHAVFLDWDTSPMENARFWIEDILAKAGLVADNLDDLEQWMKDYPIHERIVRLAETWDSEKISDEVCRYITDMPDSPTDEQLNMLAYQLRYLENYKVPLEAYRSIHKQLEATFVERIATRLSKQNLSLLMNHTLDHLEQMKPQLTTPAQPAQPVVPSYFSQQQKAAVTTHEPLSMTVAGAGTGKSSTILARIKYLESCGVPASDITVLSFTNAAADNITEKNPDVGSMTIARMIIDIYAMNHPTHKVSAIDTIINSIDIFYPNNRFAAQLRHHLLEVDKGRKPGAFTMLNTFVENHYDEVIDLLDRIQQTSLELQIIICYQRIDDMVEPAHVQSKYLIIDEVQDNSIFEFIYVLKYITKHAQSLFIVGDASQTLYEFRSANPRALNTLEASGVFATYQLTTNYRSNQEILDFANVLLGGLETNQIAGIRLQANSLDVPTADTFQDKVRVRYDERQPRVDWVRDTMPALVQNVVIPEYVDACLDRGEQVAFLAYSRREVAIIQSVLEKKYPNRHVASLVSERVFATDIFSKYIKNFWNDVLQAQPNNAAFVVSQGIKDNMEKLTKNAGNPNVEKAILRTISDWWIENQTTIDGWVRLANTGTLPVAEFFERLRDNILSFEIRRNQEKLNVNKQRNQERKKKNLESKAELVVSTIHGAKGLEFDNVVVLYKEDSKMTEDTKRMFYVAFTRAMNSEYILAYGSLKNPPIVSSHEHIVASLTSRDEKAAQAAAGVDADLLDDDNDAADDRRPVPQTA